MFRELCLFGEKPCVCSSPRVPEFTFIEDPITCARGQQLTAVYSWEHNSVTTVIPISAIKEKLVYMQCEGGGLAFVSRFPNRVESD